jgi:uncharacterized protein (DUF58 family)
MRSGRCLVASALALALQVLIAPAALIALPAVAQELPSFTVAIRDGRITPAQIEVPARRKIKLVIRNEGSSPCELENLDLRVEKVLAPGASSFVVIHSLAPGRHRFIDEFHPTGDTLELIAR